MAKKRKAYERNIRRLVQSGKGRSLCVTIPISIVRELKWRKRHKLIFTRIGDKVVMEYWDN